MTTIDKATAAVKAKLDGIGLFFTVPGESECPGARPVPFHEEIARAVLEAVKDDRRQSEEAAHPLLLCKDGPDAGP